MRLPGKSGLDLQRELAGANRELPIIFITGHGDIPMTVQAMKGGAIEFLTKPFRDQDLLDAIQLGLSRDRARLKNDEALADLRERFASLSPREREIMIQAARGRLHVVELGILSTGDQRPDTKVLLPRIAMQNAYPGRKQGDKKRAAFTPASRWALWRESESSLQAHTIAGDSEAAAGECAGTVPGIVGCDGN